MNVITELGRYRGLYRGEGVNHEGQKFTGTLKVMDLLGGRGVQIRFEARGGKGEVFHNEVSTIAPNSHGSVSLYNLNTNTPMLTEHQLVEAANGVFIFRFGDLQNGNAFREEVRLELLEEGVGYHYSWGLPGGEFAYRSGAQMPRVEAPVIQA